MLRLTDSFDMLKGLVARARAVGIESAKPTIFVFASILLIIRAHNLCSVHALVGFSIASLSASAIVIRCATTRRRIAAGLLFADFIYALFIIRAFFTAA